MNSVAKIVKVVMGKIKTNVIRVFQVSICFQMNVCRFVTKVCILLIKVLGFVENVVIIFKIAPPAAKLNANHARTGPI